jgi:energy-coupling factor transport system substrate-specific component
MVTTGRVIGSGQPASRAWRTRDIVVAAVIGVAFGVAIWAWNLLYGASQPLFAFAPWARDILYGVWLMPAIVASLVVRKPGAALFAELIAASVSALLGSQWGISSIVSGLVQGLGAEIVFLAVGYRVYSLAVVVAAAIGSAIAAWLHDWYFYYAAIDPFVQLLRGAAMVVSAAVIAGWGSVLLVRSLRQTGALDGFPE